MAVKVPPYNGTTVTTQSVASTALIYPDVYLLDTMNSRLSTIDHMTYESMSPDGNPAIIIRVDNLAEGYATYTYALDIVTVSLLYHTWEWLEKNFVKGYGVSTIVNQTHVWFPDACYISLATEKWKYTYKYTTSIRIHYSSCYAVNAR